MPVRGGQCMPGRVVHYTQVQAAHEIQGQEASVIGDQAGPATLR